MCTSIEGEYKLMARLTAKDGHFLMTAIKYSESNNSTNINIKCRQSMLMTVSAHVKVTQKEVAYR
jgi:hypothetical protein